MLPPFFILSQNFVILLSLFSQILLCGYISVEELLGVRSIGYENLEGYF